jgi:hypothetical protein
MARMFCEGRTAVTAKTPKRDGLGVFAFSTGVA